jgi:hypothetical protein
MPRPLGRALALSELLSDGSHAALHMLPFGSGALPMYAGADIWPNGSRCSIFIDPARNLEGISMRTRSIRLLIVALALGMGVPLTSTSSAENVPSTASGSSASPAIRDLIAASEKHGCKMNNIEYAIGHVMKWCVRQNAGMECSDYKCMRCESTGWGTPYRC